MIHDTSSSSSSSSSREEVSVVVPSKSEYTPAYSAGSSALRIGARPAARRRSMEGAKGARWLFARVFVALVGVKLLLVPAYHSTDFEVHRNWLAITSSQPLARWYIEDTSEWTLDYPPFFAWFEWTLAHFARAFSDREMLRVENLGYDSPSTVLFQRSTVIVTEALLAGAVLMAGRQSPRPSSAPAVLLVLIVGSAGLVIVDHIHFQYNGMLMGVFLASVVLMSQGREIPAAVLFAVALNLKHIFMYCAPVYFVHLLATYCFPRQQEQRHGSSSSSSRASFSPSRFLGLGSCVLAVFAASLGPVAATGQLRQLFGRLFPFGRGLCHAYWAANAWALYSALDKVLSAALPRLGVVVSKPAASMTGGLVGVAKFAVLPQIEPLHTAVLVLLAQAPALWSLWSRPHRSKFLHATTFANMSAFMFGFHVHEKAALMATLPMALLALESRSLAGLYIFASTTAHYAMSPLIFTPQEYGIKVALIALHFAAATVLLRNWHNSCAQRNTSTIDRSSKLVKSAGSAEHHVLPRPLLGPWEWLYLGGLCFVELYCAVIHSVVFGPSMLPFLPLMLTSVYCALGMAYAWFRLLWPYLQIDTIVVYGDG